MALSLISQLAHVELTTPKPQESLDFWTNVIGLEETTREGQSVYLRGWGDRFHHTLQADRGRAGRARRTSAGARSARRSSSARSSGSRSAGAGIGWREDSIGHGPAYQYRSPGGHVHEIFWEVERYKAPAGQESPFPNRPQGFVPRGVGARCIDHVTIATASPDGDAEVVPRHARPPLHRVHDDPGPARTTSSSASRRPASAATTSAWPGTRRQRAVASTTSPTTSRPPTTCCVRPTCCSTGRRDRVRARQARHGRAGLPLLPRAERAADRAQRRRLPQLRAGLGDGSVRAAKPARTSSTATSAMPHSMLENFPPDRDVRRSRPRRRADHRSVRLRLRRRTEMRIARYELDGSSARRRGRG